MAVCQRQKLSIAQVQMENEIAFGKTEAEVMRLSGKDPL
jgi:hypothetical protein